MGVALLKVFAYRCDNEFIHRNLGTCHSLPSFSLYCKYYNNLFRIPSLVPSYSVTGQQPLTDDFIGKRGYSQSKITEVGVGSKWELTGSKLYTSQQNLCKQLGCYGQSICTSLPHLRTVFICPLHVDMLDKATTEQMLTNCLWKEWCIAKYVLAWPWRHPSLPHFTKTNTELFGQVVILIHSECVVLFGRGKMTRDIFLCFFFQQGTSSVVRLCGNWT